MKRIALSLVLMMIPVSASAQDFLAGQAAYESGDYREAARVWRSLAEQGDARSQARLGELHDQGLGVLQDYAQATRWFRVAARHGNPDAQVNLGEAYLNGRGVEQNFREAMNWFQAAAEQGHAEGQANLGDMYLLGPGVAWSFLTARPNAAGLLTQVHGMPQDSVTAHMWFNIAATNGFEPAAERRALVERSMTSADVAMAQRRARECLESDYQDCTPPNMGSGTGVYQQVLTQNDMDALRLSIESCWDIGTMTPESLQVIVTIGFEMSPDARPIAETIHMVSASGQSPAAKAGAFEAGRQAIERCGVNGYGLPADLYDQWRLVEITFNPGRISR